MGAENGAAAQVGADQPLLVVHANVDGAPLILTYKSEMAELPVCEGRFLRKIPPTLHRTGAEPTGKDADDQDPESQNKNKNWIIQHDQPAGAARHGCGEQTNGQRRTAEQTEDTGHCAGIDLMNAHEPPARPILILLDLLTKVVVFLLIQL